MYGSVQPTKKEHADTAGHWLFLQLGALICTLECAHVAGLACCACAIAARGVLVLGDGAAAGRGHLGHALLSGACCELGCLGLRAGQEMHQG